MIMEAKESHDVLSESWRTIGADGVNPSTKTEEYRCLSSVSQVGSRFEFLLLLTVCSVQTISRLDDGYPHWGVQFTLLSLLTQMLLSCGNTHPEIMFNMGTPWFSQTDTKNYPSYCPRGSSCPLHQYALLKVKAHHNNTDGIINYNKQKTKIGHKILHTMGTINF